MIVRNKNPADEFWDFSVRLYTAPGVKDLCLDLQNAYGADVNLLMWCCWRGWVLGQPYEDRAIIAAAQRVENWRHNILMPLRHLRAQARGHGKTYDALKYAELVAERHAQNLIIGEDMQDGHPACTKGERLSLCHQALRHYLVDHLHISEGAAAMPMDAFLSALKAL